MTFQKLKIKDICNFVGGAQPPKDVFISEERDGYIRLIQTRDYKTDAYKTYIPKNLARRFCNKTDIMIGRYGPPIFQILRGLEGAYNVALMKAVPNPNVLNDYLYYIIKQKDIFEYVDKLSARTGGQTGVDLDSLNEYPVLLPDKSYQQKVLGILKGIDDKIELNNRINAQLEAMAKAIYDYWFVQFDFPNKNGKPYKASGGKMVWHEKLKREIPEGWRVEVLANVVSFLARGISPIYLDSGGICVLNQKCIRENSVRFHESRRHDNSSRDASSKLVKLYDVLVNSTGVGTLGRVALFKRFEENLTTVDSHVTIIRPSPDIIDPLFFGFTMVQKQSEIERFSQGSTGQVELSRSQLENINLIVPQIELEKRFGEIYMPIVQNVAILEKENQKLTELRDWLFPMLMNGQIKIKDAEEELSMAAEPRLNYFKIKRKA